MKKKVFSMIGVAAFAVAVALNINANIRNGVENDVVLANIEVLAMGEETDCSDGTARLCCKIWKIKYLSSGSYECTSDGSYKCKGCNE